MRINHNISAINTYRNQAQTNEKVSKSIGKLSSGLRITQAADDSAGLAISEKMRGQIRGLQMAQKNIQDGNSLVQTAEGGMAEIHSVLQRVRELSVQSANDTNTNEDRFAIQTEVTQLLEEIDRIANDTEFNGMMLLAGKMKSDGKIATSDSLADVVQSVTASNGINDKYTLNGIDYASAVVDFSNIMSSDEAMKLVGKGVHLTCSTCDKAYRIKFVNGSPDTSRQNSGHPVMEVDVSRITSGSELVEKIIESAYGGSFQFDPEYTDPTVEPWRDSPLLQLPAPATNFARHFSSASRKALLI